MVNSDPRTLAIALSYGVNILSQIVLSSGFSTLAADEQSAVLIHELLHVALNADHPAIIDLLGISKEFLVTHFNNESWSLTEFIRNGCPK